MLHETMNNLTNPSYDTMGQTGESVSLEARLTREKKFLEERLAKVSAALDGLEKNPEFAKMLQLVQDVA